jgi:hypothetical protein
MEERSLNLDPIKGIATFNGIPISKVEGLVAILENLTARIEALEAGIIAEPTPTPTTTTPVVEFLEAKPNQTKGERPVWTDQTPFNKGQSLDFGSESGNYYLRIPLPDALKNISELTICGWVKRNSDQFGAGGNRVVDWLHQSQGVDFVLTMWDGLQLGVGEFPDNAPRSGQRFQLEKWEFFAVSYSFVEGIKYFKGSQETEASLIATHADYKERLIGGGSAFLTVGNFNPELLANDASLVDRSFKGLIHELRIFNKALSLEQIKSYQSNNG